MIKVNKERILRRTGALLLTTVLCFSMFSAAANAEKPAKEQETPQQSQSVKPKSPWKTKGKKEVKQPETAIERAANAAKSVMEADHDKPAGEGTEKEASSESVSADKEVQTHTLPVLVGNTVVFTASLATDLENKQRSEDKPESGEKPKAKTEAGKSGVTSKDSGKKNPDEEPKNTADAAMEVFLFVEFQTEPKPDTADKEALKKDSSKEEAVVKDNTKKSDKTDPAKETVEKPEKEALTYIWQVDRNDGHGWTEIFNDNSKSCTLSDISKEQDGWKYQCVIVTDTGSAESDIVMLDVSESKAA